MTAKNRTKPKNLDFRPARPSDAEQASKLLYASSPKKNTFIVGLGSETRAKKILARIFQVEGHRLSYQFARMALYDGKVIGMVVAYPGRSLARLDWRLYRLMLAQYGLRAKLALISRALPMIFIKEAARDEFLISNLAVKKGQRGKGFGSQILRRIEQQAVENKLEKVALMVSIENQAAKRFYERNGYAVKAIHLESDKRVRVLGSGYLLMIKELDE